MQLPRFMTAKEIPTRGITRVGTLNVSYRDLTKKFGNPTLSAAAGDDFDGFETIAWRFKFENGLIAEISDLNEFGNKNDYQDCSKWAIYGHTGSVVDYIKGYLGLK